MVIRPGRVTRPHGSAAGALGTATAAAPPGAAVSAGAAAPAVLAGAAVSEAASVGSVAEVAEAAVGNAPASIDRSQDRYRDALAFYNVWWR